MSFNLLDHFLLSQVFTFILIFCRLGSAIMVLPAFSENYVSPRIRLMLGFAMSALLTPLLQNMVPDVPSTMGDMLLLIIAEILVGVFLGLLVRMLLSAMHVTGTIIASQSSLALASVFDVSQGGQSAIVSNFLSITAITLFFALNMHHIVFAGLVDSYQVFQVGSFPIIDDMSQMMVRKATDAFMVGVQLAAPHLVFSLIFYLVGGLLTRLMPNFQIFFVLVPPQILLSVLLLIMLLSSMMMFYMTHVEDELMNLTGGL
ncbi:MAG: flagellar biosynthetic protein FliR [Alphaproteobacteria bacterium]|nr:flagellar biosynthetic protein FliR [Alphaproteobacteria bacterium]